MLKDKIVLLTGVLVILGSAALHADIFTGTLYYTNFTGGPNVNKIDYSYDDVTNAFVLSNQANIASAFGADGIIFATNGNLLVGGQGSGLVHEYTPGGALVGDGFAGTASFHLTLDPSGAFVYTSDFEGPLDILPLGPGPVVGPGVVHPLTPAPTGGDSGLTQLAFAPATGNVFYVNGFPNAGGNVGIIDLSTFTTSRLYSSVFPAHGIVFDSYTGLMTLFGGGVTGTFDQTGAGLKIGGPFACDFDQGAVDGKGHALVAGCSSITFLDYSKSGDITAPNFVTVVGGFAGIDDVAPLSGVGSQPNVPEPSSIFLLGSALAGFVAYRRRRSQTT